MPCCWLRKHYNDYVVDHDHNRNKFDDHEQHDDHDSRNNYYNIEHDYHNRNVKHDDIQFDNVNCRNRRLLHKQHRRRIHLCCRDAK